MINQEIRWYEVRDSSTGEVLSRGHNIRYKTNRPGNIHLRYVCTDDKWFFNMDSDKFIIKQIEPMTEEDVIPFTREKEYEWGYWSDVSRDEDIYRDWSIDELDEEVRPLVEELNKWDGVQTVGSCCGHGRGPLWVQINFQGVSNANIILNILRSPEVFPKMLDKFTIDISSKNHFSMQYYQCYRSGGWDNAILGYIDGLRPLYLVLASTDVGEEAYKSAELFTRYLKQTREIMIENDMMREVN